ncbi:MAG: serine/threonine-protein kinase [Planctomycetia bacterium]|nr:serine/threonine-protein kinase [Planctomycetia bacterium]
MIQPNNVPSKTDKSKDPQQDEILFAVLDEYTRRFPDGNFPDRAQIESAHPELSPRLWECLQGLAMIQGVSAKDQTPQFLNKDFHSQSEFLPENKKQNEVQSPFPPGFSSSPTDDLSQSILPKPLGDFQLIREIGRGGMGIVYEARQFSLGRLVALKILPFASTVDQRQLQRFHNEATAAANLEHPGIVPIYAIGCERGVHYYAMRLINGQHLGVIIQDLRLHNGIREIPDSAETSFSSHVSYYTTTHDSKDKADKDTSHFQESQNLESTPPYHDLTTEVSQLYSHNRRSFYRSVANYMKQAAEALDYAHQCGVIHRDIKPANLLVDTDGKLWITDFGLAHIQSNVHLTQTGEIFGTPRYMSPEQAQGQNRLVDHRVDIYSLGATFYELLTLHAIFAEKNQVRLLHRITHEEPRLPHSYDPQIPHDLETILLKCIAKNSQERYETAGELANDLTCFLQDRPIMAKRPGILDITRKWLRRHPSVIWTTLVIMMVIMGALLINRHTLKESRRETLAALDKAHARFHQARLAADTLINIAREDLGDGPSPALRKTRQKLLDTALLLYQDFLTHDELDPETEAQITAMQNYILQFMESLTELEGMPPLHLLFLPDVHRDLHLTAQQHQELNTLREEIQQSGGEIFRKTRNMDPDERLAHMIRNMRSKVTRVQEILTAEQFQRLIQIGIQIRSDAITDPQIATILQLTEQQKQKIQEILIQQEILDRIMQDTAANIPTDPPERGKNPPERNKLHEWSRTPPPKLNHNPELQNTPPVRDEMPGPPPETPSDYLNKKQRSALQAELESILTKDQLKTWKELCGPPFSQTSGKKRFMPRPHFLEIPDREHP